MLDSSHKLGTIKSITNHEASIYQVNLQTDRSYFNIYGSNAFLYLLHTMGIGGRQQFTLDAKHLGRFPFESDNLVFENIFPTHIYTSIENPCLRYSSVAQKSGLHTDLVGFSNENPLKGNLTSGMLVTVNPQLNDTLKACLILDNVWQLSEVTDEALIYLLLSNKILPLTADGDFIIPSEYLDET